MSLESQSHLLQLFLIGLGQIGTVNGFQEQSQKNSSDPALYSAIPRRKVMYSFITGSGCLQPHLGDISSLTVNRKLDYDVQPRLPQCAEINLN